MDVERVTKEARLNFRKELVNRFQRSREQLLPSLHWVQEEYGYLPEWALEILSWHLGVPASEVYGAATTYPELTLDAPQSHEVAVCTGLTCRESGSQRLLAKTRNLFVRNGLNIVVNEVPCLFSCAVSPVVLIDGVLVGAATEELVDKEVDFEQA